MDQLSFASLDFAAKKRTNRDVFLAEMAAVVPWGMLEALIEPHYPKKHHSDPRDSISAAGMERRHQTRHVAVKTVARKGQPDPEEAGVAPVREASSFVMTSR